MRLDALLDRRDLPPPVAALDVRGLASDSRKVLPGYLFAALPGAQRDGRQFIADALKRGASAIVQEGPNPQLQWEPDAPPQLTIDNARRALALMARRFFRYLPSHIVAVTGTNGKSSVVEFVRQFWAAADRRAASIGTLGVRGTAHDKLFALEHTTPEPVLLHHILRDLYALGIDHLALEASSHALTQARLDGVSIAAAGFTNLSRDHMDYHLNLSDYRAAKLRLFTELLPPKAPAVVHVGSAEGRAFAERVRQSGRKLIAVGGRSGGLAVLRQTSIAEGWDMKLSWQGRTYEWVLPLAGDFQVENVLTAMGLALASGLGMDQVVRTATALTAPPGRMELIGQCPNGAPVFVDYAHTPAALARALQSLMPGGEGDIVLVFGCGGNRDQGKRSEMGRIAEELASHVILTDDNPRTEVPEHIRRQILAGMRARSAVQDIGDRRAAIRTALEMAAPGQTVLVAGKGHEEGQLVGRTLHPFSDRAVVEDCLQALRGEGRANNG